MEFQPLITPNGPLSVSKLLSSRKRSDLLLYSAIIVVTFCLVPILIIGGIVIGFGYSITILALLIISMLVIRWPTLGFFIVLGCTLLIEQNPLPLIPSSFYVFGWPPSLQGLPDRPIGFFMLFILLVSILHNLLKRQKILQGGKLLLPYLCFLACVLWGIVHGLSSGGDLKITINEIRSFWYLFLGYLLAYNLIQTKKHLYFIFWFIIICAGIKALEGVYIYVFVIHGDLSANRDIMAHEESYFWVAILLLTMLFSLHYKYRPQFYTALALIPFLLIALIANNRRADFVALLVGMMVAWVLIFAVKPRARKLLVIFLVVFLLLGGAYVATFYNGQGGFSEPARAIVSVFRPDPSDASSNLYRAIEDYDLIYTVKLNPMGLGFGKPFLQPILLPDVSVFDPVYNYIPHNTIYWVWMRLGPIGYLALWYLFGAMIVRGSLIARKLKDPYLQLIAIYTVSMIVIEIIVAFADYQLSFYRNVIYVGMLAGILMRLPTVDKQEVTLTKEATHSQTELPNSYVGKRYA
jgi:nitrate reductase NapE component